jgi:DNA-binding PadR family transcriptional regulator
MYQNRFEEIERGWVRFSGRGPERGPGCGQHGDYHGRMRHGRGEGGFPGGFEGRGFGHGFRHGRERLFDAGDIKLVILKLLSEQPSYGYQIMKTMEERLAGGYIPSAGIVYPTLTMLAEEGLAVESLDGTKRVYSITPQGQDFLEAHKERIGELFARLDEAGEGFRRGRSPEVMKAFHNLRNAVLARISRETITPERILQIAKAINDAARAVDEI